MNTRPIHDDEIIQFRKMLKEVSLIGMSILMECLSKEMKVRGR